MHDVAIIGAGVVGAATARELARRRLSVLVCEAGPDVASGSSRANSGIVHAGHDARPGSRKAVFGLAGNRLFDQLAAELGFAFRRCGSLVLARSSEEAARLDALREQGAANGVAGLEILGRTELRRLEPNLNPRVLAALSAPSGGIVSPYEMTIALAENAAANGVEFRFSCRVEQAAGNGNGGFRLSTARGPVEAGMLINAAGLYADQINNLLSGEKIHIKPRRGEYVLLDRSEGGLARHTLFPLPGKMGKGVLVTPTVDGNLLLGPTAEDVEDKEDSDSTGAGQARILEAAALHLDRLPADRIIASFAGLRAHLDSDDFQVGPAPDVPGLFNFCGVESPGLTSAPALAREAARWVDEILSPPSNPDFNPVRRTRTRFRDMDNGARAACLAGDPDYGDIVCRCEQVSLAEIRAALRSPLAPDCLDAVKRRTRAGMGRCQGGFCGMRLPGILAEELGVPLEAVTRFGPGSELLRRRNKSGWPD